MWDLPGPEIEPLPPALAGGFLTTVPPGILCTLKTPCAAISMAFLLRIPPPSGLLSEILAQKKLAFMSAGPQLLLPSVLLICAELIILENGVECIIYCNILGTA